MIDLLKLNKVQLIPLTTDTTIEVEAYRIEDYKTAPRQGEGHHINSDVIISSGIRSVKFRKGDFYIPMNQAANRFLVEVLEPQAPDSYFAWNFFDAILGQKEGFSDYAFEETAMEILKDNPEIKVKLEAQKKTDTALAKSATAQLSFIYRLSPYYETAHLQYPVYRVVKE